MAIYRGENAAVDAMQACTENELKSGGHSWGLAFPAGGELVIVKAVGEIPEAAVNLAPGAEVALAHTRMATRGEVCLENAHPFAVKDVDGEVVAALAHNGTWYGAPENGAGRCDSYYIARLLEDLLIPERDFREAVRLAGEVTGETITVLHRDGTGYVYSGRYGVTEGDGCVKSTGGTPIPDGSVTTI